MRGVLPREKEGQTQRCTKEKGIKTDTEIEVMHLQAKGHHLLSTIPTVQERRLQ